MTTEENNVDVAIQAAENAQIAAKAASESATAIAVVANDVSWMKKSLLGIENTLAEMRNNYVTFSQHTELVKLLENHEQRIISLETDKTRTTVLLRIGIGILTLLTSILTYHILH